MIPELLSKNYFGHIDTVKKTLSLERMLSKYATKMLLSKYATKMHGF